MSYVIYHKETTRYLTDSKYETVQAAKAQRTKICKRDQLDPSEYNVERYDIFCETIQKQKIVKNMMSGEDVQIPVNTPVHLDPSCETYWQM